MKDVEGDLKKLKVGLESEKRLEGKRVNFNVVGICDLTCWLKVVGCKIAVGYGALPLATFTDIRIIRSDPNARISFTFYIIEIYRT